MKVSILITFLSLVALTGCEQQDLDGVEEIKWQRLDAEFPPPICEGTPWPVPKLPVEIAGRPQRPPIAIVPDGTTNLALGKKAVSSDQYPIIGNVSQITDGLKKAGEGYFVELIGGAQWVSIDLGQTSVIYAIWIWHQAGWDNDVYHDVVIEISEDPKFEEGVTQVFNNDYDNSLGLGKGEDAPYIESNYGKRIQLNGVRGKYLRFHSNGCGRHDLNRYVEIEVYGLAQSKIQTNALLPTDPKAFYAAFENHFWEYARKNRLYPNTIRNLKFEDEGILVITANEDGHKHWRNIYLLWKELMPDYPLSQIVFEFKKSHSGRTSLGSTKEGKILDQSIFYENFEMDQSFVITIEKQN